MKRREHFAVLALLALGAVSGAQAQTQRSGGAAANTQALMQLQQISAERTALQAENAKLKGELAKASQERDSLKDAQETIMKRGRGAEAELARVVSDRARLEGDLAQQKDRVQELASRLRDAAGSLREVEMDNDTTKRSLSAREQEMHACVDRNAKLYELNGQVLSRFERLGLWSAVAGHEPFTKLKRIQLENLADDFRNRADEQRLAPAP